MRALAVVLVLCGALVAAACPPWWVFRTPRPESVPEVANGTSTSRRPVVVRDTGLDRRINQLELQLLEKQAQVEELQSRLDDARREVVRAMAKLQTLATRAEAASGMAEAEIALQALRAARGGGVQAAAEIGQAAQLLQFAVLEFNRQNYGGALYLATQAKAAAGVGQARLASVERGSLRSGEVPFAVPLRLRTVARANVREGPGGGFAILFVLDADAPLTGYSYVEQWVRIADATGRGGWIFQGLIDRRP